MYKVIYDQMTGVMNRQSLDKAYLNIKEKSYRFSAIMLDIDSFKIIDDTYGHAFGDTVLINICSVIKNILNYRADIYRYGSEKFIILVVNKSNYEVVVLEEQIRFTVANI